MDAAWLTPTLGDELVRSDELLGCVNDVATDVAAGRVNVASLVECMASVLTHGQAECRARGVYFLSGTLAALPPDLLQREQLQLLSTFYTGRLRDHHSVVPAVLAGYRALVCMSHLLPAAAADFLAVLFREVACQTLPRAERAHVYCIVQHLLRRHPQYLKSLGGEFVYGVVAAMDGERDPRNLLVLFELVPELCAAVPLAGLADDLWDVLACYFPIDFTPAPDDPAAVTRQHLASALAPCLCAAPQFAEPCLLLLVEKLDSSLRLAKIDSLQLLEQSCKVFDVSAYAPFVKTIWSSLQRELNHKMDEELVASALRALHALARKLGEYDQLDAHDVLIAAVVASAQAALADAKTSVAFERIARTLLVCADASLPSCLQTSRAVIPSIVAFHSLQLGPATVRDAALVFLADLHALGRARGVLPDLADLAEQAPCLCLRVLCEPGPPSAAALRTLAATADAAPADLVPALAAELTSLLRSGEDERAASAARALAAHHPDLVTLHVVDRLPPGPGRLCMLAQLVAIDGFAAGSVSELLGALQTGAAGAGAALHAAVSDAALGSGERLRRLERDHALVDELVAWLTSAVSEFAVPATLAYGYSLIAVTMGRLTSSRQTQLVVAHTPPLLALCERHESYMLVLEALYCSLRRDAGGETPARVVGVSLARALGGAEAPVRRAACVLLAHALNKASDSYFPALHARLQESVRGAHNTEYALHLAAFITKSLILRGNDEFSDWLQKIVSSLRDEAYCMSAADDIRLLVDDDDKCLSASCHCRVSLLYKQRLFQTFLQLTPPDQRDQCGSTKTREAILLSWGYILGSVPCAVLNAHIHQVLPLVLEALQSEVSALLERMLRVLLGALRSAPRPPDLPLHTLLPRILTLATCAPSMAVRLGSLEVLHCAADRLPTRATLPHRAACLAALAPALDDRKRLVRAAAVRAASRWTLIGAPGEPT